KETEAITSLFLPNLHLEPGGNLDGSFRSAEKNLILDGYLPKFKFTTLEFNEIEIDGKNNTDSLEIDFNINSVSLSDSAFLHNVEVDLTTFFNTVKASINWDNKSQKMNEAEINIEAAFNGFDNFSMVFHDS